MFINLGCFGAKTCEILHVSLITKKMANKTGGSIGTGNLNLRNYVMAEPHTRNENMSTIVYDKTNDAIKSIVFLLN